MRYTYLRFTYLLTYGIHLSTLTHTVGQAAEMNDDISNVR